MDIVLVHPPYLHLLFLLYFSEFKCFAIKKKKTCPSFITSNIQIVL